MDMITYAGHAAGAIEPPHAFRQRMNSLFRRLARTYQARRDLKVLRNSGDHLLDDIGISRSQLDAALNAPFWVDPSHQLARRTPLFRR